jgi:serine/threonine-protein kinase
MGWHVSTTLGDVLMTETGSIFGTPLYMSPEHARGAQDCDERSDIWSLGVTLCELVTGDSPFVGANGGPTPGRIFFGLLSDAPMRLPDSFPSVPSGLDTATLKCLAKDRAKRYQNVAELAVALVEFGSERAKPLVDRICGFSSRYP